MKQTSHMTKTTLCARLIFTLVLFGLNSCAKPVPVQVNSACQREHNNLYVSIEGYLSTGASVLCSSADGTRACGLELSDTPGGTARINVYVEEGTGKSQMEPLPKLYSKESLKVRADNGHVLGSKDRVRIIGIAKNGTEVANSSATICYVDVEKIEQP